MGIHMMTLAYIMTKPPALPPETMTFYPGHGSGRTSVDGYVRKYKAVTYLTWEEVTTGDGEDAGYSATSFACEVRRTSLHPNKYTNVGRLFYLFDTSALPSNCTIIKADFIVGAEDKYNNGFDAAFNIFGSNPLSNTAIVKTDFSRVSSVPFATKIPFADIVEHSQNTWHLNSAGLAAINKTGITKFSLREANHDAPNIEPDWAVNKVVWSEFFFVNQVTAAFRPRLVVTYR